MCVALEYNLPLEVMFIHRVQRREIGFFVEEKVCWKDTHTHNSTQSTIADGTMDVVVRCLKVRRSMEENISEGPVFFIQGLLHTTTNLEKVLERFRFLNKRDGEIGR